MCLNCCFERDGVRLAPLSIHTQRYLFTVPSAAAKDWVSAGPTTSIFNLFLTEAVWSLAVSYATKKPSSLLFPVHRAILGTREMQLHVATVYIHHWPICNSFHCARLRLVTEAVAAKILQHHHVPELRPIGFGEMLPLGVQRSSGDYLALPRTNIQGYDDCNIDEAVPHASSLSETFGFNLRRVGRRRRRRLLP